MKKTISILMALALICVSALPAFAAELDENNTSGTATAVYKAGQTTDDKGTEDPSDDVVGGTYTITIPDYVAVAKASETPTEYDVIAKDVLIPYGTSLTVTMAYDELELSGDTMTYDMKANPQSASSLTTVASGDTILTVGAGTPTAVTTTKIAAVITDAPIYAGVYTDTVTFNVAVK